LASREWASSASASGSRLRHTGPGNLARRALPGLFLCFGLGFLFLPETPVPFVSPLGAASAEAAASQLTPPDDGPPPVENGVNRGNEPDPEGEVFPDTTRLVAPELGPKPVPSDSLGAPGDTMGVRQDTTRVPTDTTGVRNDSTRVTRPAMGIPQSGPATPAIMEGPPVAAMKPPPGKPKARRGVFGVHPAVIILGLVAAHVFLIKLITK
jgi:hypothetical protein